VRCFYLIGFVVLVSLDTSAQLSFKMAAEAAAPFAADGAWLFRVLREPWIYAALCCYLGTFFTWITLLVRAPIGPAYAASHLEVVSVLMLSRWLFNEPIAGSQIAGCVLIVAGITCLAAAAGRTSALKLADPSGHFRSGSAG
jgi:drug/metabolite transporter (DMT)-like permease